MTLSVSNILSGCAEPERRPPVILNVSPMSVSNILRSLGEGDPPAYAGLAACLQGAPGVGAVDGHTVQGVVVDDAHVVYGVNAVCVRAGGIVLPGMRLRPSHSLTNHTLITIRGYATWSPFCRGTPVDYEPSSEYPTTANKRVRLAVLYLSQQWSLLLLTISSLCTSLGAQSPTR